MPINVNNAEADAHAPLRRDGRVASEAIVIAHARGDRARQNQETPQETAARLRAQHGIRLSRRAASTSAEVYDEMWEGVMFVAPLRSSPSLRTSRRRGGSRRHLHPPAAAGPHRGGLEAVLALATDKFNVPVRPLADRPGIPGRPPDRHPRLPPAEETRPWPLRRSSFPPGAAMGSISAIACTMPPRVRSACRSSPRRTSSAGPTRCGPLGRTDSHGPAYVCQRTCTVGSDCE